MKNKLCGVTVFLLLNVCIVLGQATQGSIFGTVTDSSGAVVPHANVTITSVEQGVSRTTVSSDAGEYRVSDLELGSYVVSVEAPGFKKAESSSIQITVKAIVRVDMQLQMGVLSQTVQVLGVSSLIRTGSAEVSNVIGQQELEQLPVLNQNLISIASLTAGTNQGNATGRQAITSGAEIVVNGTPPEGNNFILDGVSDNMEFSGTIATLPPMQAMQEFAVQVSQYSAEFGRGAGGVINMSLKSGTNQIHGFAYDYFQNDGLNARAYNFTGVYQPRLPLHQNRYGVGAGGPIVKNKVFWFGDWQGLRYSTQRLGSFIVPTAAEKKGDFSNAGFSIYDPATGAPNPSNLSQTIRQQFPGNIIPPNRINSVGSALLNYYPDPNYTSPIPGVLTNYLLNIPSTQSGNSYNAKIDANLSPSNSLSGHYSQQILHYASNSLVPEVTGSTTSQNGTNVGITYTKIFSPTLLNEARVSYNRFVLPSSLDHSTNIMDQYHIPGWPTGANSDGFPQLIPTNLTGIAAARELSWVSIPLKITENTYQYLDTINWQKGSHAIKAGVEVDHLRVNENPGISGGGALVFNGVYTTQTVGGTVTAPRNGAADMLLGDSSELAATYLLSPSVGFKTYRISEFVQDDWRVTPALTVNLGLRYDIFMPYHEEHDRVINFNPSLGVVIIPNTAKLYMQNVVGLPNGTLPNHWQYVPTNQIYPSLNKTNFSPRVGFAYAVNPTLSLRAGFGIFYDATVANDFVNGSLSNVNYPDVATVATPVQVSAGLPAGGVVATISGPSYGAYYAPIHRPNPYSEKYDVDLQWGPNPSLLFDIGYEGALSLNFPTLVPGNQAPVPGPGTLQTRRPYPNFGDFYEYAPIDKTNYNGLTATVAMNNSHGLLLRSAFTFSKTLGYDTGTDGTLATIYNPRYDYGPLDYDITNRWVTSAVYQIPVKQSSGRVSRSILSGWETSGIFTMESGFPFSPTDSGVALNVGSVGGTGNRPNVVPHVSLRPRNRSIYEWFNTAAFQNPPAYTFGNAGKNMLRGPGLIDLDLALQKRIRLPWEGQNVFLRMETSNLFNHPNWGNPSANISASNFGIIQSTQSNMRVVQAVLRYDF